MRLLCLMAEHTEVKSPEELPGSRDAVVLEGQRRPGCFGCRKRQCDEVTELNTLEMLRPRLLVVDLRLQVSPLPFIVRSTVTGRLLVQIGEYLRCFDLMLL